MYRQAESKNFAGAIATGKEIKQIILSSAKLGRPAAFAMHPSADKGQMTLDRLKSELNRQKREMQIAPVLFTISCCNIITGFLSRRGFESWKSAAVMEICWLP